jgi:hypothetical protein
MQAEPIPGHPSPVTNFPPQDIRSFLTCCAGEWLALRSRFALDTGYRLAGAGAGAGARAEGEGLEDGAPEAWHDSERGELLVAYLEPEMVGDPGGLAITPPATGSGHHPCLQLIFSACGRFHRRAPGGDGEGEGSWHLRPDGSLEMTIGQGSSVVKERIWFTKPNLRLRSSVEHRADGLPGRASFSSEIRRVRSPQEPAATPAA